jgi:DNA-binding transcriptional ArsR family regulator
MRRVVKAPGCAALTALACVPGGWVRMRRREEARRSLGHPGCAVLTEKPVQPTLFYPARGITESWARGHADAQRALAELMGEGRARVLGALDAPRTTTETAEHCGLAVSTTSRHLALLRNAGLVMTARRNPYAVHNRTALGDAPLAPSPSLAGPV